MTVQAKIVVSAIDSASATMLRIRANMRAMTQPMRDIKSSMGRFADASGMKQIGRDMSKVARGARSVAKGVRSILSPMTAFLGVGTIAGIAEMSKSWANLGWNIQRTATTLGMAPGQLQALRGAAKLAGLSSDDMTSSLHSLGNVMYGAKWGGDTQTRAAMNALGMHFRMTKKGGIDTAQTLMDVSKAVRHYSGNAQLQEKIAHQFGVESMLPLLRQGPEAIKKFEVEAKRLGYVLGGDALNKSKALGKSFAEMSLSLSGLRNRIAASLFPTLGPLVNKLTDWIAANRVLIGQRVAEWVAKIVQWVRSVDWGAVWRGIKQVVAGIAGIAAGATALATALGGWKQTIELAFGAWALGKVVIFTVAIWKLVAAMRALRGGLPGAGTPAAPKGGTPGPKGAPGAPGATGDAAAADAGAFEEAGAGWAERTLGARFLGAAGPVGLGAYLLAKPKGLDRGEALELKKLYLADLEQRRGLPKGLLDAVWWKESARGKHMRSPAGALGDFQFMPDTARRYGLKDPMNFTSSARTAAGMFGDLFRQYRGNIRKSLAAYNWGSGNLDKDIKAHGDRWLSYAPKETQQYVNAVQGEMAGVANPYAYAAGRIGAPQASPQRVEVEVTLANVPAGAKVTAKDEKGKSVPVRVAYNLVGAH